jgi:ferredoxin-NADP reductase
MTVTDLRLTRADAPPAAPADRRAGVPPSRNATRLIRDGLRRAAESVTTPLVPADYLDLFDPLGSRAQLRGRIEEVLPETADAATLVIRPGRGWTGHQPGQYVRLGVDVDGVRLWRAYSITSGPRRDGRIALTVKVIPDGRVSTYLVRRVVPGTVVQMDRATGDFTLPEPLPTRLLFLTAGSGITPVMGILRHQLPHLGDVVVVHSAPAAEDVIFGAELRDMARVGRIRLLERHTDADGVLDPEDLAEIVPDWARRPAWACGPAGMLDDLEAHWARAGASDLLHTERFRARVLVAGSGGEVAFGERGPVVDADGGTPLLEVGEAAGVLMPSGCRMGICYGCVLPLRSGAVRDLRTGALTTAEPGDGVQVQTCVSAAAGPCHIDLPGNAPDGMGPSGARSAHGNERNPA